MTPEEFAAANKSFRELEDARERNEWERMRTLATITIQPHTKKKITAKQLMRFPWDSQSAAEEKTQTQAQRMAQAADALKRLGTI